MKVKFDYNINDFVIKDDKIVKYVGDKDIETLVLPPSVKTIGKGVFTNLKELKQVVMFDDVETIEEGAFKLCRNLEEVAFSNNLKIIDKSAFECCYNLKRVWLPKTLEELRSKAFGSCCKINSFKVFRNCVIWPNAITGSNLNIIAVKPDSDYLYCFNKNEKSEDTYNLLKKNSYDLAVFSDVNLKLCCYLNTEKRFEIRAREREEYLKGLKKK